MSQSEWAILTDVTKCIGCEACVEGCRVANDTGTDRPWPWQGKINDLSATRWTTIERLEKNRLGEKRFVRLQCRHCNEPACVSACPVGALEKTEEGPVVYDSTKCMGCRYCMMACPFHIPRYTWDEAVPSIRKCVMCFDSIMSGTRDQPACTASCPTGATIFGRRSELLDEAKQRIREDPGGYIPHVWGETEAGGPAVLNVSDVDIGLPKTVPADALPGRTWGVLQTVPFVFVGMGAAMLGLRWIVGRRNKLRAGGD